MYRIFILLIISYITSSQETETNQCSSKLEWVNCDICSSEISYISDNEWAVIIFNNIWQPHKDNVKERSTTQKCLV